MSVHNRRDAKKAITTNIANLNNAISSSNITLQKVVTGCEEKTLITTDFKDTVLDSLTGRTVLERASQLTSYIQTTVALCSADIDTFLCVLIESKNKACTAVAEDIATIYGCHRLPAFAKVVSVDKIDGGSCTEGSQCTKTASTKNTKPELRDLVNILVPLAPKYLAVGIRLNVPIDELGLYHLPRFHQDDLITILNWWTKNGDKVGSPVNWDTIITAIDSDIIGNYEIVKKLKIFSVKKFVY